MLEGGKGLLGRMLCELPVVVGVLWGRMALRWWWWLWLDGHGDGGVLCEGGMCFSLCWRGG